MACLWKLLLVACAGLVAVQGAPDCHEQTLPNCLRALQQKQQTVSLISNKDALETECRVMKDAIQCADDFLDHCIDSSKKSEASAQLSGLREAVKSLCDDIRLKEELLYNEGCYKKASSDWDICGNTFLQEATSGGDLCGTRNKFFKCAHTAGEKSCTPAAATSVCKMAIAMVGPIVPSTSCATSGLELCTSLGISLQPTVALLLVAVLLGVRNLFARV